MIRLELEDEHGLHVCEISEADKAEYARARARGFVEMDEDEGCDHMGFTHLLEGPVDGLDANLRLAIQEELCRLGRRNHLQRMQALAERYQQSDDYELEEQARYREAKRILEDPIVQADFEAVEQIEWSHDSPLLHALDPNWGGDDQHFNICSLEGLERCCKLRRLEIVWQEFDDLSPVRHLKLLETATLESCQVEDLSALAELPALRRLTVSGPSRLEPANQPALDSLRQRGVEVEARFSGG